VVCDQLHCSLTQCAVYGIFLASRMHQLHARQTLIDTPSLVVYDVSSALSASLNSKHYARPRYTLCILTQIVIDASMASRQGACRPGHASRAKH
jgi:hypothetical protein